MNDPELDALRKIIAALDALEPPTRQRALRYLLDRYSPYDQPADLPTTPAEESP